MNLASRSLSFFRSLLSKRLIVGVLTVTFGFAALFSPPKVIAQTAPAQTAPAAGSAVNVASESEFGSIMSNASSVQCSSPAPCLLSVVGFIVTFIFSVISYFLSKLLILLTSVLITFARYNKFNLAPPVQIGWVIVRDIANMFFIVVVLISAFMTIIGKAEDFGFHYGKVIPKLLIAAIMVNFSKTIILLAIDFSQVVMLTFVSAFEGTIAGNLIQGFGITQMVQFQQSAPATGAADVAINLLNICLAYILSIFLLVTAVATILLYVGFFIARIIGLWLIIIASPMAFLVTSLPDKVKGSLGGSINDFWGKFTKLLTGGPLVAFFLWLTFATIQQTSQTGVANAGIGFDFPEGTPGFVTRIGTAPQLASFIIGIAMMIAGFQAATQAAGSVGLSGVAGFVSKQKDAAFKMLSRSPLSAARAVGRGARFTGNALDRRFGLSNQLASGIARGRNGVGTGASALTRVGGAIGSAARVIPVVGGTMAAGAAGALAGRRAGLLSEDKKKLDARMKDINNLSPEDRVLALRELANAPGAGLLGPALIEAQHEALGKDENRKAALKNYEAQAKTDINKSIDAEKAKFLAQNPNGDVGHIEARRSDVDRQAKALAGQRLANEEAERITQLRGYAKDGNDKVREKALETESEKRMIFGSESEYAAQVQKIVDDPSKLKDVDAEQMKSGRFAFAIMSQAGVTDANGTKVDRTRLDRLKETYKDNKELVKTFDLVAKQIEGSAPGTNNRDVVQNTVRQEDQYGAQRLYGTQGNGEALYTGKETDAMELLRSNTSGRTAGAPLTPEQHTAIAAAMSAKLPVGQIKSIVDRGDDGATVDYLAARAATAANIPDQEVALKELATMLQHMEKLNATKEQMVAALKNGLGDPAKADKFFVGYGQLGKKGQADTASIISYAVKYEDADTDLQNTMRHVRAEVFPEQATEPRWTGRTRTVQKKVQVKTGNKIPRVDPVTGDPVMKMVNGTPVRVIDDEMREEVVTEQQDIEEKRVASGVIRQLLRQQNQTPE